MFEHGPVSKGAWIDIARGLDHHDPGNRTLNEWWPFLPLYKEGVHSADGLNHKSVGDALEQAAGISFAAATGERFLVHNNMGRLHFPTIRARDAWARVWALFHRLGLGPGVAPECVGYAGLVAEHRILWRPCEDQAPIQAPTRGLGTYEEMAGMHGPNGEAAGVITWGPDEELRVHFSVTWVSGLGTFFRR